MDQALRERLRAVAAEADVQAAIGLARQRERTGDLPGAASAWDLAYGLAPDDGDLARARGDVLDRLAVRAHGLTWRYVPAGAFRMGSADGEPDERPVHAVELDAFWLTEAPLTWVDYARLLGQEPPPAWPEASDYRHVNAHKIRVHYGGFRWDEPERPEAESEPALPVTAVGWDAAVELCARLSGEEALVRLPSEAEWEKAARGGRVGARYPWGDAPAGPETCDCARFDQVAILPSHTFPPNGYGLYAMAGGLWEWTADRYDALAYRERVSGLLPEAAPPPPGGWWERVRAAVGRAAAPEEPPVLRVVRGGSWADDPAVCTVSFRHALHPQLGSDTPVIGLRLAREARRGP